MKKILFLLIALTTLTYISYASFPIEIISRPDPAHKIVEGILKGIVLILGIFVLYNIYRLYRYLFGVIKNSYRFWSKFFAILSLLILSLIFICIPILAIYRGGVGG